MKKTVLVVRVQELLSEGQRARFFTQDEEGNGFAGVTLLLHELKEEGNNTHFTGTDLTHPWFTFPVSGFLPKNGQPGKMFYE